MFQTIKAYLTVTSEPSRALTSMFIGPLTGPWAKIVLTHLKKLEKSWKIGSSVFKKGKHIENWRATLKSFNILEHYELKGKSIYSIMYTEDVKIQENLVASKIFWKIGNKYSNIRKDPHW